MDVLQLIKEDHELLRTKMKQISEATAVATRRKLVEELGKTVNRHLYLESEYLYPEVSDLYHGAEVFIKSSTTTHKAIKKNLTELYQLTTKKPQSPKQAVDEKLSKLASLIEKHLAEEEAHLMPKIRELIPTQDREDLGQVFIDMLESEAGSGAGKKGLVFN